MTSYLTAKKADNPLRSRRSRAITRRHQPTWVTNERRGSPLSLALIKRLRSCFLPSKSVHAKGYTRDYTEERAIFICQKTFLPCDSFLRPKSIPPISHGPSRRHSLGLHIPPPLEASHFHIFPPSLHFKLTFLSETSVRLTLRRGDADPVCLTRLSG